MTRADAGPQQKLLRSQAGPELVVSLSSALPGDENSIVTLPQPRGWNSHESRRMWPSQVAFFFKPGSNGAT